MENIYGSAFCKWSLEDGSRVNDGLPVQNSSSADLDRMRSWGMSPSEIESFLALPWRINFKPGHDHDTGLRVSQDIPALLAWYSEHGAITEEQYELELLRFTLRLAQT